MNRRNSTQLIKKGSGKGGSADIRSMDLNYLHFGNEAGEKFVILPGLALKSVLGSAEAIISAYALLAKDYDMYLFDHIPEEPEGYEIADMAEDTLAAFDQLGLAHVHLMGVSMGGMVAQTIALKASGRVASLILCSTAMSSAYADPAVFAKWKALAEERNTPELMAAFGESVYTPAFYEDTAEHRNVVFADTLEVIENIILFSISNYFLRFSNMYISIHGEHSLDDNNWYEFVEYGTTNEMTVFLQRNGFSRESANYIKDHPEYIFRADEGLKLRRSLLKCKNNDAREEAELILLNRPQLFENE